MANKHARSLKQMVTNGGGFRDRAIAEYHELLAADETLTPATFKKLRSAMRKSRLLYGERPIGVALRPHLLHEKQFQALTHTAQQIASALEKIAAAVVRRPTHRDRVKATSSRSRTISRTDSLGRTRYERVGKGCSRSGARSEADG